MDEFFRTRMGQKFYEHTMPELVKQLERLTDVLERIVESEDAGNSRPKEGSVD